MALAGYGENAACSNGSCERVEGTGKAQKTPSEISPTPTRLI